MFFTRAVERNPFPAAHAHSRPARRPRTRERGFFCPTLLRPELFGDGVNIAARLEELAKPGSIYTSARVQEDASGKLELAFVNFGEQQLKNIARPVRVYTIPLDTESAKASGLKQQTLPLPDKPSIAVLPFANLSGDPEQAYCSGSLIVHWR